MYITLKCKFNRAEMNQNVYWVITLGSEKREKMPNRHRWTIGTTELGVIYTEGNSALC